MINMIQDMFFENPIYCQKIWGNRDARQIRKKDTLRMSNYLFEEKVDDIFITPSQ